MNHCRDNASGTPVAESLSPVRMVACSALPSQLAMAASVFGGQQGSNSGADGRNGFSVKPGSYRIGTSLKADLQECRAQRRRLL